MMPKFTPASETYRYHCLFGSTAMYHLYYILYRCTMGLYKEGVASTGPMVTSGEGHSPLPAAEAVSRLAVRLIADAPYATRYVGTIFPRGVWHVGQAGLGDYPGDSSGTTVAKQTFSRFLHSELEDWWIPPTNAGTFLAASVWWRWLPGVQVEIEVFW